MPKNLRRAAPLVLLLCLFVFAVQAGGCLPFNSVKVGSLRVTNDVTELDARGASVTDVEPILSLTSLLTLDLRDNEITAEDYARIREALPDCAVRWSVPLSGGRFDSESETLTVPAFSEADIALLAYFPNLSAVDASGSGDYAALRQAQEKYGEVSFVWTVPLFNENHENSCTELDASGRNADADALLAALPGLPLVTRVSFGDDAVAEDDMRALREAYPDVVFDWALEILPGLTARGADETLTFGKCTVDDPDALAEKLLLLAGLRTADMADCGLDTERMLALREKVPGVKFVWRIRVSGWEIRTDLQGFSTGVRSSFPNGGGRYMGGTDGYTSFVNGHFDNLVYCTDLVALDIGHCSKISDISFIEKLPQLRYVVLAMLNVSDISVLAGQSQLEFLEIYENPITDLTPLLSSRDTLKYLNCGMCDFTDVDVLCQLTNLERLWIAESKLTDEQIVQLRAALPNTIIMASRSRVDGAGAWRTGNWGYVEMQRIFGLRAQFQGNTTPSPAPPELSPTPEP